MYRHGRTEVDISNQWVVAYYSKDGGLLWLSGLGTYFEPRDREYDSCLDNAMRFDVKIDAINEASRSECILTLDFAKAIVAGEL